MKMAMNFVLFLQNRKHKKKGLIVDDINPMQEIIVFVNEEKNNVEDIIMDENLEKKID